MRELPHPHLYFNSARRSPADVSAAASPQVSHDAAVGRKCAGIAQMESSRFVGGRAQTQALLPAPSFRSAAGLSADVPAAANEPVALVANPPAAAGNEYPHSVGVRGCPAAASPTTDAAAGRHYSFGSGPRNHQPGSNGQGRARYRVTCAAAAEFNLDRLCAASSRLPSAARASLKLGQFAQALLDVLAVLYLGFFAALFASSILIAVFLFLYLF